MSGPWSNPCFKSMCQIREPNPRRLSPCSTVRVCVATGVFESGTFQICKRKSSLFGEKYRKDIPAMGNKGFIRYGRVRKGKSYSPKLSAIRPSSAKMSGPWSNPCFKSMCQIREPNPRRLGPCSTVRVCVATGVFQSGTFQICKRKSLWREI